MKEYFLYDSGCKVQARDVARVLTCAHAGSLFTSIADPDPVFLGHPDPVKTRIRILSPQTDPC